jgi:hypothetical protein
MPVTPERLSTSWSVLLGQRVCMSAKVERRLEMTQALLVAGSHKFAVTLAPNDGWEGTREQAFTVMGSTTVKIDGGEVTLPALLFAPCEQ